MLFIIEKYKRFTFSTKIKESKIGDHATFNDVLPLRRQDVVFCSTADD